MSGPRTIIVGAGHAGLAVAAKLRQLSPEAVITIISAEAAMPYQRPPLSKAFLSGKVVFEQILIKPESWYLENRIELLRGVSVASIDRQSNKIALSDNTTLPFDHLVLALGSTPRRLPAEVGGHLPNVHTMRDLGDALGLKEQMSAGKNLVVIGGGYIGLEAASEASKLGLRVTVIEAADRILQRVAAKETADFVRILHQSHGVDIRENTKLGTIVEESGRAIGIRLSEGEFIPADIILTGIGVTPVTAIAESVGLQIENGIALNDYLQTSDPNIFAAGDCASFLMNGVRVRLESVQNANDQGNCIATNIAGSRTLYRAVPWFWSDQFDLKLQIAGLNIGYDNVVERQGPNPNAHAHFYFKGDRFLSVDCLNDPLTFALSRKILDAKIGLSPVQATNPNFILKSLIF